MKTASFYEDIHFHTHSSPFGRSDPRQLFHRNFELYFQLQGKRRFHIGNDADVFLEAPAALLIRPAVLHSFYSPDNNGYMSAVIGFMPDMFDRYEELLADSILSSPAQAQAFKPSRRMCIEFANDISRIYESTHRYRQSMLEARLYETICELTLIGATETVKPISGITEESAVVTILTYIDNNLSGQLRAEDAASMIGYTPNGLSQLLKMYTGMSWRGYVMSRRCECALRMLIMPGENDGRVIPINEIAEICGFGSANYFGDFICHRIGIPPTEYRRRYLGRIAEDEPLPLI